MQNSELYRRGVVVPLNEGAEQAVTNNDVRNSTQVQAYEFSSSDLFYNLFEKGLFEEINQRLETMIDDYEETKIQIDRVPDLKRILIKLSNPKRYNLVEIQAISELVKLCDLAMDRGRALFFIL